MFSVLAGSAGILVRLETHVSLFASVPSGPPGRAQVCPSGSSSSPHLSPGSAPPGDPPCHLRHMLAAHRHKKGRRWLDMVHSCQISASGIFWPITTTIHPTAPELPGCQHANTLQVKGPWPDTGPQADIRSAGSCFPGGQTVCPPGFVHFLPRPLSGGTAEGELGPRHLRVTQDAAHCPGGPSGQHLRLPSLAGLGAFL